MPEQLSDQIQQNVAHNSLAEAPNPFAHTEFLTDEASELSTDAVLGMPEELGIASTFADGSKTEIVGQVGFPAIDGHVAQKTGERQTIEPTFSMLVMKVTKNGKDSFAIGGMSKNKDGKLIANNKWVQLHEDNPVSFGRSQEATKSLWPDRTFDQSVSRNHLNITWDTKKGKIVVNNLGGNETAFTKGEVIADQKVVEELGEEAVKHTIETPFDKLSVETADEPAKQVVIEKPIDVSQEEAGLYEEISAGAESLPEAEPNVEIEYEKPEAATIFASADSIEQALHNPMLDPDMKITLHTIVDAWRDISNGRVIDKAWDENIVPAVDRLREKLPNMSVKLQDAVEKVEYAHLGFSQLTQAIEQGDVEYLAEVMQRYQPFHSFEAFYEVADGIMTDEQFAHAAMQLFGEHFNQDELVAASFRRNNPDAPLSEDAGEALTAEVQPLISSGADLEAIAASISANQPPAKMTEWRHKQQVIESVLGFTRITANIQDGLYRPLLALNNVFEATRDDWARTHFDSQSTYEIETGLIAVAQEFADLLSYMRSMQYEAESIK